MDPKGNTEYDPLTQGLEYSDLVRQDRMGFIRKVLGILCVQLAFTAAFCVLVWYGPGVQEWMLENLWLFYVLLVFPLFVIVAFLCFRNTAKKVPYNYILLFLFTLAESYTLGLFVSLFDGELVVIGVSLTVVITGALSAYAVFTKHDFTTWIGGVIVASIALIFLAIFVAVSQSRIVGLIFCTIAIMIFGMYIVIDAQMLVGGKRWELSSDDYILGAIALYIDIIGLFIYIMSFLRRT